MKINIKVTPNARKNEIIKDGNDFKVRLNVSAVDGKANSALIEFLADYFNVKKSKIRIAKGQKSRNKIIEVTS